MLLILLFQLLFGKFEELLELLLDKRLKVVEILEASLCSVGGHV